MENMTLQVRKLRTCFQSPRGDALPVNDVSLDIPKGSIVGLVGESGCGKSMTARSIIRLIKYPGKTVGGEVLLEGRDLLKLSEREMTEVRGRDVSMIFQEPMTSLNPVMRVGKQVAEALRLHQNISRAEARGKVIEMFETVGISDAARRYDCYPHELSGGLRQRVMIAMAMICKPKLLIADEPTTALDVTVEAQILLLMKRLRDETGTSILLISHNLGCVAEICDHVYVMYAGRVVEAASTKELFSDPRHPYTKGLLNSIRSLEEREETLQTIPGVVPQLKDLPDGCSFAPRCGSSCVACGECVPELTEVSTGHFVRCREV